MTNAVGEMSVNYSYGKDFFNDIAARVTGILNR